MEPPERLVASPQLPADEDAGQSAGQTSINLLGTLSNSEATQDQRQPIVETDGRELQQLLRHSLQPGFQDSNLSPALPLLPVNSGVDHVSSEYSLFLQSDNEFAPLRAYPDISMASERFHLPPLDHTTQASEDGSLSQHPLAQATTLSEEGRNSCYFLSQHSLSPGEEVRRKEIVHSPLTATTDSQGVTFRNEKGDREKDLDTQGDPQSKPVGETAEDETFFLRKEIPAQHLLQLLQKDIGMPSSSSSAVSSASETSVKIVASFSKESKSTQVCKPGMDQSKVRREGPPGEAALPQQQTQQPVRDSYPDRSRTSSSEVCNITVGLRSTQPDASSKLLHRELLSDVERRSSREAGSENQQRKSPVQSLTPCQTKMSKGKPSVTRTNLGDVPWTGPFSVGIERGHREQDLWSSGNQTGIDGSYLGFLPQSQSTPGVFKAPPKSSVKANLGQLSAIESSKENSYESKKGISPQPAVPVADFSCPDPSNQCQEEATSAKVQSLPSLNYMQKVDAWRANQTSGKTSLFDSLALQGFSGISPKKKAYDAVSDTLNRILSQQARSLQQPPVSSAAIQNITQMSPTAPSGSLLKRGEAVGSAPGDKDNTGSSTRPSASSFGRSQSHSSLSTVVTVKKDQQTETRAENEKSQTHSEVHHQPGATGQPSPLVGLGQFSDVSTDQDLTLSSSQESYNNGNKLGTSIGASSAVSLEVDNYAPYWTSGPSTPRPRELNIEERIPLYLHNLGIDQSPSAILTPFAPRGPIREPEFSPTDLCTVKGSVGTSTKSTQPSEGDSPHKGEFSRSSVLSVDSSMSIPFSLDSLGPAASVPERTRRASPSSDTEDLQSERRLASSSQPDEDSYPSTLQTALHQHRDSSLTSSQNTIQLEDRLESDLSLAADAKFGDGDLESPLQTSRSMEQSAEVSFVSSKALLEIRKLLSQAENVVSAGSSVASSFSPGAHRPVSDENIFLSLRKKSSILQDSSFSSSSATEDPRSQSSLLCVRSSSDSMLSSEKMRESLIGQESMASSWQSNNPPTQASNTAPSTDAYKMQQDSTVSRGVGSSFVLSQSARRAEPEGCSAAPPDNKVPPQPPVIQPSPALSTQQLTSTPTNVVGVTEDEKQTTLEGPVLSSSSSPILEETDQGVQSDGSSESSLAIRVAKLLQSESPATMVSSTASITDQEESKAREWIKLKISGQQCEPLELDKEDRKRIEEIKRELLLKNPIKSQGSTDTESSAASSIRVQRGQDPAQQTEPFTALSDANIKTAQALQSCSTEPFDSSVQLPPRPNLEAQIREIAAREGVNLPRTNPRALTSITIATRRRSTSSSPSVSPVPPLSPAPELLQLTELSTGAVELPQANRQLSPTMEEKDKTAMQPASVCEPSSSFHTRNQNLTPQSAPGDQRRQVTVGGQFEKPLPPFQALGKEDVNVEEDNIQFLGRDEEVSSQDGSISGDNEAKQATGSSSPDSPARTAHVSHVRLTLSPKATDQSLATAVHSSHADAVLVLPRKEFVPLRHSSSAASSLDEGVGLSSPPDWYDNREPIRQQRPERADTSTLFKTAVPEGRMTSTSPQPLTPCHRVVMSPRPLTTESPAVPALLPYKPRGSEELFYVPQTEADFSSTDTTMESTHTGSDDAVPPRFSSEVLGHRDPGLDRGVTIRHTEGIYSKRLKTAAFKMQEPEHRGVSVSADKSSQTSVTRAPKSSSQVSFAFTRVPLSSSQEASERDQGTSPMQFPSGAQPEPSREGFQPVHVETDYDKAGHHLDRSSVPQAGGGRVQERRDSDLLHHAAQRSSSSLDQLWQRFCDEWSVEESRPTRDREASLLERLERLSRLIHSTKGTNKSEAFCDPEERLGGRGEDATGRARKNPVVEVRRSAGGEAREMEWKVRGSGKVEGEPLVPQQAWTQRLQVEETSQPADEESSTSSFSHDPSPGRHVCPADRDESETLSTTSGSMSTVDTARLIRAFGAHRVQHLKASSGLSKLYNTINKQKDRREAQRARNKEQHHMVSLSETTGTDESTVAGDSASSASTYTLPSHHGPSRTPTAKRAVKMVSKGIQAGDLELVSNGTRRHTRDVGTTFPSPGEATTSRSISSSSSSKERGGGGRTHRLQRQRESKKSPSKTYPEGVSWFISADDLRSEARKENRPQEEESTWRPSTAWFEPYSRIRPWREPLRQRQVHEDGNKQPGFTQHAEPDLEPRTKTGSSGLARISLQEALEMRRPEFISQSRQRVRRLALQVEERKLQEVFSRERDELFSRPGGPGRLPKPAGTALLRRAVPRKEMIQRSKQIYESLPEVQRRREEERRKAEYQSYRLNAQLFNKRITGRVLGRRTAWQ